MNMEPLNKSVIGQRIKSLRKATGLRQWQMAQLLAATQPAVHKYENGILPEVKRLMEIARIGNTSIEWILTGRHWENGSEKMDRLDRDVFDLADQMHSLSAQDRDILTGALEVIHSTIAGLRSSTRREPREMSDSELGRSLKALESHALEPLVAALAIYDAVVTTLSSSRVRDLHRFGQPASEGEKKGGRGALPTIRQNVN